MVARFFILKSLLSHSYPSLSYITIKGIKLSNKKPPRFLSRGSDCVLGSDRQPRIERSHIEVMLTYVGIKISLTDAIVHP